MPSELSQQVYIISKPFPDKEYLLIESRGPYKWSADWASDREQDVSGLAVMHVDEKAPLQSERGYPGHTNWPAEHYRVSLLQKDGNYDIEKMVNIGDAGDLYRKDDVLGPGPSTWPNTDSYQGGQQVQTGLTVEILTDYDDIMEFQVSGYKPWQE